MPGMYLSINGKLLGEESTGINGLHWKIFLRPGEKRFQRFCFLSSDTHNAGNLTRVFDVLDRRPEILKEIMRASLDRSAISATVEGFSEFWCRGKQKSRFEDQNETKWPSD